VQERTRVALVDFSKLKACLFGFLANVLGLLSIIVSVYLCLTIFSLLFALLSEASRSQAEVKGLLPHTGSVLDYVRNSIAGKLEDLFQALWGAKMAFLIFGVLGAFAAWAYQTGRMVHWDRAWLGSFICVALIIIISITTWAVAERAELTAWMADKPQTFGLRDVLLKSYFLQVGLGLYFGLPFAYVIWVVWRWWYIRVTRWLSPAMLATEPQPPAQALSVGQEGWRSYASRLHELKRETTITASRPEGLETPAAQAVLTPIQQLLQSGKLIKPLALSLIVCVILLIPLNRYHDRVAVRLQHGTVRLDSLMRSHEEAVVSIEADARKISVVKEWGSGTVSLYLSPSADYGAAVQSVTDWSFGSREKYIYVSIPVAGLEPGDYHLHFVQESGAALFEYTLSQGGGKVSHASALGVGFLLGCSLILALALIVTGVARLRRG